MRTTETGLESPIFGGKRSWQVYKRKRTFRVQGLDRKILRLVMFTPRCLRSRVGWGYQRELADPTHSKSRTNHAEQEVVPFASTELCGLQQDWELDKIPDFFDWYHRIQRFWTSAIDQDGVLIDVQDGSPELPWAMPEIPCIGDEILHPHIVIL